jgi:comEA protein
MVRMALSLLALGVLLTAALPAQTRPSPTPAAAAAAAPTVNLNTATLAELQALPGIGAKTAERIVQYREKNGPFKKIEELMNVQGIGEKSFLKLRAHLTVAARPAAGTRD